MHEWKIHQKAMHATDQNKAGEGDGEYHNRVGRRCDLKQGGTGNPYCKNEFEQRPEEDERASPVDA